MSLFGRQEKAPADLQESLQKAELALARVKALELAFEELQDKVYRWMQRTRKREAADAGQPGGNGGTPGTGAQLHPTVARVLARRGVRRGVSEALSGEG